MELSSVTRSRFFPVCANDEPAFDTVTVNIDPEALIVKYQE